MQAATTSDFRQPDVPRADRLLDTREAARQLGLSPSYLAKRRITGGTDSPIFIKLGKLVRYAQKDIDAYLESRRRRSTSEAG
jgi:predicted DNA-binding transcriptional regulator AlpA